MVQPPPFLQRQPSCLVSQVHLQLRDDDVRDDDIYDAGGGGDDDDAHRWFDVATKASGAMPRFDDQDKTRLVSVKVSGEVYLERGGRPIRTKILQPGATYYFRVFFDSLGLVSPEDIALGTDAKSASVKVMGKPSDVCHVTLPILFPPDAPRAEMEAGPDEDARWQLKLNWQPRTKRDRNKAPEDYKAAYLLQGYTSSTLLGLKWCETGKTSDKSRELTNEALARALQSKREFTLQQWRSFNVPDLRPDHYIQSGSRYFEPAVWEEIDVTRVESGDGVSATVTSRDLEMLGVARGDQLVFRALAFLIDRDGRDDRDSWRRPHLRGETEYKASKLSNVIRLPDVSVPPKPEVMLTRSAEEFEVLWEPPTTVESAVSRYEISVLANGVPLETPSRTAPDADRPAEYKCSFPGAKIEASVRAYTDRVGFSAWSPVAELVLPLLRAPGQPRGESATSKEHAQPVALSATDAQLVWDEPGTDFCKLLRYEVHVWQCSASEEDRLLEVITVEPESAGAKPPCRLMLTRLTPKQQYAAMVRAVALSEPQSAEEPQVELTAESVRSTAFRMPWLENLVLAEEQQPKVAADAGEWKAPTLTPLDRSVLQVAWRQPEHTDCILEAYLIDLRQVSRPAGAAEDVVASSRRIAVAPRDASDVATTMFRAKTGSLATWKEEDQDFGAVEATSPNMKIEIDGLSPGATYQVQVTAVTYARVQLTAVDYADMNMGLTASTGPSEPTTMPDVGGPVLPWATPLSLGAVRLEWTPPVSIIACTIEAYEVELQCHVEREVDARVSFADVAKDELRVKVQFAQGLVAGDWLVS